NNVSIGTSYAGYIAAPSNGMIVQGNVGIGSAIPGQALDVTGTVRTVSFAMSGQTPISGYVLTASDSAGDTTWTSPGAVSGWTISGNDVYETLQGNVGIGTTTINQAALTVTNGNVGIGTWAPAASLEVAGGNIILGNDQNLEFRRGSDNDPNVINMWASSGVSDTLNIKLGNSGNLNQSLNILNSSSVSQIVLLGNGNVGIGTIAPAAVFGVVGNIGIGSGMNSSYVSTTPPTGGMLVEGNVGLGSLSPGQQLDVQGTVRMTGLTLTNNGASDGFVLVGNSIGIGTWMSASTLPATSQWAGITGLNIYYSYPGANVGIGTSLSSSTLDVANNVSIGTSYAGYITAPNNGLLVQGNVGIGSTAPGQALDVTGTVRTTGFAMSGQTPISGYVLTASDSAGDTTWS
ncbi:MAG: hypothetical protein ACREGC_02990, partial [Minisyncoccia bacterium]